MSEIRMSLVDVCDLAVSDGISWNYDDSLSLTFNVGGRDAVHESARKKVFDAAFMAEVKARLEESAGRWRKIGPKVKDAEKDMADLHRKLKRLEVVREEAMDKLTGEKLTLKLSQLAEADEAARARLAASEKGLQALRDEAAGLRTALEGSFAYAVRDAANKRLNALAGMRKRFSSSLATVPLAVALTTYIDERAQAAALEDEPNRLRACRPVLDEVLG
jgi:hypothetical protein